MDNIDIEEELSCSGCFNRLEASEYVSAVGSNWHTDCFRCSVCDSLLSAWYFEKDGLLFCQSDYWSKYGESCQCCGSVMTGPVMVAGEHRFHPECFICSSCGIIIEDGEAYALVERSKLFCGKCYNIFTTATQTSRPAHSIRTIELPPIDNTGVMTHHIKISPSVNRAPITLQYGCQGISIKEIDANSGLTSSLHIGDNVLEVNGTPVTNQTLQEIQQSFSQTDSPLQLTIEHDPDKPQTCKLTTNHSKKYKSNTLSHLERKTKHTDEMVCTLTPKVPSLLLNGKFKVPCKERLFKKKGEEIQMCRDHRRSSSGSPGLMEKERSSSMSKLFDVIDGDEHKHNCDLNRAKSFRVDAFNQRVFRASDLVQGELLGCGFFGQVYKVTHRDTNEVMVLKQLYRVDEDAQRSFLKEVAVLRSLSHPNVLRFIGVLYKDKRLHLITEYVAGGTLSQLLQQSCKELTWCMRVKLAQDIAAGMSYLHKCNVIHRDLNSHNCLVREDKTVIVADFGLARIVQRANVSGTNTITRRKRYTVVGNPYWMAPEMMKGNVYDEKVDIFSYGIILCEIIGRVQADPDFLPRRPDFGLNEVLFREKFCNGCPEPLYRIAFMCCDLDPDLRPIFEITERWLDKMSLHMSTNMPIPDEVMMEIEQHQTIDNYTPDFQLSNDKCGVDVTGTDCICESEVIQKRKRTESEGLPKSTGNKTNSGIPDTEVIFKNCLAITNGRTLGKCVSASHISQPQRPIVTITKLSRSQNTLLNTPSGYLVSADDRNIKLTKVDDITEWLDPPHSKRTTNLMTDSNIPAFLRNQSVEELESQNKCVVPLLPPICRHFSIPDKKDIDNVDSESDISSESCDVLHIDNVISRLDSYDNVVVREPLKTGQSVFYHDDNFISMKEDNCQAPSENDRSCLAMKLLSPKLGRLFQQNKCSTDTKKQKNEDKKCKSKFFIQSPMLNRVRPSDQNDIYKEHDVSPCDLKLASFGKPMTPTFRRHKYDDSRFQDGRFSWRNKHSDGKIDLKKCRPLTSEPNSLPLCRSNNLNDVPSLSSGNNCLGDCSQSTENSLKCLTKENNKNLSKLKITKSKQNDLKVPLERII